jgi:hypothetical protein
MMSGMWIDPTTGLILQGHLQLMSSTSRDDIARVKRSIVGNDDGFLIAEEFVNGNSIVAITVLLKDKTLEVLSNNGIDRQDNLIGPSLYRHR